MTDILATINHFWPNTVRRYSATNASFPEGSIATPCCGGFVEIINGSTLPSDSDISARFADYNAYAALQQSNNEIKNQIDALEKTSQTERRVREAFSDPTWMNALNAQIASLRSQII